MIELNDDKTLFFFDRDLEPVLTVKSGETVRIRTKDCFSNQLTGPQDTMDDLDWDAVNPATGPVFVEGAKAGGALKVRIDNIEFDEQTCSATGQDEGVCGNRFTEWATHYCKIQGNTLAWDERLNIPLRPMIGVIGVAPEGTPGSHGGNMDNTAITTGATLYFPVAVDGALFGCGDMHAAMGDGEVSVSGAEVAGYATVTLTAMPELKLVNPLIENDTHFGIIVSAESLRPLSWPFSRWSTCWLLAPASPRPTWSCCCRWSPTCRCARWWTRRRRCVSWCRSTCWMPSASRCSCKTGNEEPASVVLAGSFAFGQKETAPRIGVAGRFGGRCE